MACSPAWPNWAKEAPGAATGVRAAAAAGQQALRRCRSHCPSTTAPTPAPGPVTHWTRIKKRDGTELNSGDRVKLRSFRYANFCECGTSG